MLSGKKVCLYSCCLHLKTTEPKKEKKCPKNKKMHLRKIEIKNDNMQNE